MKIYGVNLAEGSEIVNLSVALGTSYPSNPNAGELFFRTDSPNVGLYVHDGSAWALIQTSASSGTVTSVAVSGGSTGLTTSGGPITSSGTITFAGTLNISNGGTGQTTANAAFNALVPVQTSNANKVLLTNGTDTFWSYQTTTLTGDVTGSGMNSFATTLATVNSNVGGFGSATKASTFTVNAKGLVIAAGEVTVTPAWSSITSTPTTLSGYGITDAQPLDGDLTAIAALSTNGFAKRTGANTWVIDTNTYITGNQTITLSGDFTGSGTTTITGTLATVNSTTGSFGSATQTGSFTVNGKGLITAASNVTITPAFSSITSTPTTLAGYGITDAVHSNTAITAGTATKITYDAKGLVTAGTTLSAGDIPNIAESQVTNLVTDLSNKQPLDADLTAIAALTGTSGFLKTTGAGVWSVDTATYITGNQTITISGDTTGSGTTAITTTLATVNSNVGSFASATQVGTFTVNAKGLITAASNVTVTPAFSSITSKPTTLSGYGITDAAPLSHVSDFSLHLTSGQNTLIDAITATATEINYTVGVTSSIQTQLDAKVAKAGSSMNSTANITFSGGGEVLGLPTTPSGATAATSKAYVDALTSASATWRNPIVDPDLYDIVSSEPGSPVLGTTYIATTAGTWTGSVSVSVGSVVTYLATGAGWLVVKTLAAGDRFLVTGEHGTGAGSTLGAFVISTHTVVHNDLVQYNGGTITSSASWTLPEGFAGGSPTITQGVTVLDNASNSEHLGHTYLYNATSNVWVEIAGPGAVGAGTGLSYSGNVLNVNLGAGIVQLPTDEVGIDVYSTGGLMTTVNGTSSSTVTSAQLALTEVGTAGTYKSVTTDSKGRVTAGTNPTTLSGFGITDAQPLDADLTAIAALTGTSGFLKTNGSGTWSVDTATYLTGNQSITLSGDFTGTGTTAITGTLATVNSNVGTFGSATQASVVTVNAKGLVTAASNVTVTPAFSSITSKPTTLAGYGITDGALDSLVVHLAGTETITGAKTFTTAVTINSLSGTALTVNGDTLHYATDTNNAVRIQNQSSTAARFPKLEITNYSGTFLGHPVVELVRYRGSLATPTSAASADILGGFNTWGYNGTGVISATRIEGIAENLFSTSVDAGIKFSVTLAGTQSERMRITSAGAVDLKPGTITGNFYLNASSGNPVINFDANDYLLYDRTANAFNHFIGSTNILQVTSTTTTAPTFTSTVASGTAPLTVTSPTVVTNLNADLLDGQHGTYYATDANVVHLAGTETITGTKTFTAANVNLTGTNPILNMGVSGTANTSTIRFHTGATAAANYDSNIVATGGNGTDGQGSLNFNSFSTTVTGNLFWVYARTFLEPAGTSDAFTVSGSMGDNTGTTPLINATDTHTIVTATSGNSLTVNTYASNIRFSTNPIANAVHFVANDPTLISGATLTSQSGFAANLSVAGTNNYGFYGNVTAATGNYNFYTATTAANLFTGPTTFTGTVVVPTPAADNQAATKNYADTIAMAMAIVFG